jgi:23S rRNA-/tRNA-specific pseudouridylate synthase
VILAKSAVAAGALAAQIRDKRVQKTYLARVLDPNGLFPAQTTVEVLPNSSHVA